MQEIWKDSLVKQKYLTEFIFLCLVYEISKVNQCHCSCIQQQATICEDIGIWYEGEKQEESTYKNINPSYLNKRKFRQSQELYKRKGKYFEDLDE